MGGEPEQRRNGEKINTHNSYHLFDPQVGKMPRRRERLPTPVFWPGEFHELYSPWGHKESDTTERLSLIHSPCYVRKPRE